MNSGIILGFLRRFEVFRELETENRGLRLDLDRCRTSHQEVTAELSAARADKEKVWAMMQEALENERLAMRTQVNHAVQRTGGTPPYQNAHSLPPNQPQEPVGRHGRILPSEAIARNNAAVMNQIIERLEPHT
jgi:hypothetical protein